MLFRKSLLALASAAMMMVPLTGHAASGVGQNYVSGLVGNITSTRDGVLVRMDDLLTPTNCPSPQKWMQINAQDQAMISTFLTFWGGGNRRFVIYTDNWSGVGHCIITQIDPAE